MNRLVLPILFLLATTLPGPAENVVLSTNGVAQKRIRIPNNASPALQTTAATLASTLNQITGGTFITETYDPQIGPSAGIVLGLSTDLNLTSEVPVPGTNIKIRERYLMASANSAGYLLLVGATDLAVQNAVYDLLEKLNCRWFFASPNWSIIPSTSSLTWSTPALLRTKSVTAGSVTLSMNIYADEMPAFKMRYIWGEYVGSSGENGDWRQQELDWKTWAERNRLTSGYFINASHSYDAVISWAKNNNRWSDNYYSLVNGVRDSTGQLSLGQPAVQQLLRDYALSRLTGSVESVSLEPRDNTRWGTDPQDEAIQPLSSGFVTNRVVTANNYAASGIPDGKFIGMYAYSMHSTAPTINVHDKIYVLIATRFLSHGNTMSSLLRDWGARAHNLGIRDFFSVWDWDFNLPAKGSAANLENLQRDIPYYLANNADVYSAESTDGWGPLGLGYYIASKLLWNPNADVPALKTDFLNRSFGPAAETMRGFYDHIDPSNHFPLGDDLMGRLYGYLNTARGQTSDARIIARLNDLTLYLHYVDLARDYGTDSETVLRYAWTIRSTNMMSSLACWRKFSGVWPDGKNWQIKYPDHPWKANTTYTPAQIAQMNLDGINANPILPVEPKSFTDDLVVSGATAGTRGTFSNTRGLTSYFIRGNASGVLPTLNIANGFSYTDRGNAIWKLYTDDGLTELETGVIPPDRVVRPVTFTTQEVGKNFLFTYDDARATSSMNWAAGSKVTVCAGSGRTLNQNGRASRLYFYVPKGTTYVEAFASSISDCTFYNAGGTVKRAFTANQSNVDIVIPVSPGEDATIWYVTQMTATAFEFRNVPGLFAVNRDELLIPRDACADLLPIGQAATVRGSTGNFRFTNYYYLGTRTDGSLPPVTITQGLIYTTNGSLAWTLYDEDGRTPLQSGTVAADRVARTVTFATPVRRGTYLLKADDKGAGFTLTWTAGDTVSIAADPLHPFGNYTRAGRLYFYVPAGQQLISFAANSSSDCAFYNGAGTLVYSFPGGTSGSIAVPTGQAGQIWYLNNAKTTSFRFLNMPGIFALNKNELLVPRWTLIPQ